MAEKLKVLFVASEGVPFAKTGGLADVVGTLPYALQKLGVEVKVLMPYYGAVKQGKLPTVRVAEDLEVTLPEPLNLPFDLMAPESPDYPFWFVARVSSTSAANSTAPPRATMSTIWSASPFSAAQCCPPAGRWASSRI